MAFTIVKPCGGSVHRNLYVLVILKCCVSLEVLSISHLQGFEKTKNIIIEHSMLNNVYETLGVSPARMIFGRDLTLPIDLAMGRPVREEKHCVTDYAYELEQRLLDIHEYARKHLKIASDSMKRQYDVKANQINYSIGDAVWYFKPGRRKGFNPKTQIHWKGPYVVTQRLNEVLYHIQAGLKTKSEIVYHDAIRPYLCDDRPTWFIKDTN